MPASSSANIVVGVSNQLENEHKAKALSLFLAQGMDDKAFAAKVYFNEQTKQYFAITGGLSEPTTIKFGNPELVKEFDNPLAYSEAFLDTERNSTLRKKERDFLNNLVKNYDESNLVLSGWKEIGTLERTLEGETHFNGTIPIGLPFSFNSKYFTNLALTHIANSNRVEDSLRRDPKIVFYSGGEGDRPYAKVKIDINIPVEYKGFKSEQPVKGELIYDLQDATLVGYSYKQPDGKEIQISLSATTFNRAEQIILGELAKSENLTLESKGTISFAQHDYERRHAEQMVNDFMQRLDSVFEQLTPYLNEELPREFHEAGSKNVNSLVLNFLYWKTLKRDIETAIPNFQVKEETITDINCPQIRERIHNGLLSIVENNRSELGVIINTIDEDLKTFLYLPYLAKPEIYITKYPNLTIALQDQKDGIVKSNDPKVINEVIDALLKQELSFILKANSCTEIELDLNFSGESHILKLSQSGVFTRMNYSLLNLVNHGSFSEGQSEERIGNTVKYAVSRSADPEKKLTEILGFNITDVWKQLKSLNYIGGYNQQILLLDALGFSVKYRTNKSKFISSDISDPKVRRFNSMLIAGLQKMHEISHVVIEDNSLREPREAADNSGRCGPMSFERFCKLYPEGIRTNTLVFSSPNKVGDDDPKYYPSEIFKVPFYLASQGFQFNETNMQWEKSD